MILLLTLLLQDVEVLVKRLDAKDSKGAFAAIALLAERPRDAVEAAIAKLPAEAAFYRSVLRSELAAREAMGDAWQAVTRVTLKAKDEPITTVVQDMERQAGIKLTYTLADDSRPEPPRVSLTLEDVPLFEAVAAVCAAGGAKAYVSSNEVSLFVDGSGQIAQFAYRGFMVSIHEISRTWKKEFGGGARGTIALTLDLAYDPRQRIVAVGPFEIAEAVDDRATR